MLDVTPELVAGLRLIRTPGIGPVRYHGLVAKFGSAAEALDSLPDLIERMPGKRRFDLVSEDTIHREIDLIDRSDAKLVSITHDSYPRYLKEVSDAPPFLIVFGNIDALTKPSLSIVGARNASTNGKRIATTLARDLSQAGYTIWSGLARGIDTAAHAGAIDTSTVAVMAGGADVIYPKENKNLHQQIVECGAVVSEMPLGTEPQAQYFPRRNRIISGAGCGVIVVEGTPRSGSLITARLALDQGREIFAVPGSPLDPRAQGPNSLIRDGAVLVQSADDVLQELDMMMPVFQQATADSQIPRQHVEIKEEMDSGTLRELLLEQIGASAVTVDELRRQCQVSAPAIAEALIDLEIEGLIERLPGNRVSGLGRV